ASARALLAELVEEGVDRYDAPSPPEARSADPPAPTAPRPAEARLPDLAPDTPVSAWGDPTNLTEVRDALGECTRCGLAGGRTQIVFGDGNPHADLMFIGEGPGREEDRRGLPFVGRAGELLTVMIEKGLGIPRSDVYICNVVKCRPPNNRTPLEPEVAACRPFLMGQIAAVKPVVIVTLGKPAASLLLGREVAITRIRGQWQSFEGIPLMPTLHPAYILRQYTPENRRHVWEDMKAALARSREG
ncbi:MAG: uracil-DNA glycosylase, partial [Myxococcota bacterium]